MALEAAAVVTGVQYRLLYLLTCLLLAVITGQGDASEPAPGTTKRPQIVDDPQLTNAVSHAREAFLKAKPFNRCDVAVLTSDTSGSDVWRRGQVNGKNYTYPASAIKLAYLAAAMHWCRQNNKPPQALDAAVRPMIEKSDNVQTGVVVDAITQAPNIADIQTTSDVRYAPWFAARHYTMNFLQGENLLQGQVLLHKTYPTNSGSDLAGAEKFARADGGMNTMQPLASAELMLRIATGSLEPQATNYMRDVLTHDRWGFSSATGPGFPPGTLYLNKAGWAYTNANDIAYAELPDGKRMVLSVFSNAYIQPYKSDPSPHEKTVLGEFAELLLLELGWIHNADEGYFGVSAEQVKMSGAWQKFSGTGCAPSGAPGAGTAALTKPCGDGSARLQWPLSLKRTGLYEVCVAYPQSPDRTSAASYVVHHADGATSVAVDQRHIGGRWKKLGDFRFEPGSGSIELSDAGAPGTSVAAGAVRALAWPE
jgi:hypothetical protein